MSGEKWTGNNWKWIYEYEWLLCLSWAAGTTRGELQAHGTDDLEPLLGLSFNGVCLLRRKLSRFKRLAASRRGHRRRWNADLPFLRILRVMVSSFCSRVVT